MYLTMKNGKIFAIREKSDMQEERIEERKKDPFDQYLSRLDEVEKIEKQKFESVPKCGKHAHAYRKKYDNIRILELRQSGKSLQEIANIFHCSKSTIRNRLNRLGPVDIDIQMGKVEREYDVSNIKLSIQER